MLIATASFIPNDILIEKIENIYEEVDGKNQITEQTIKQLRPNDSLPVTILTKYFNHEDDVRLLYLTGLSKEDGLQEFLLDSFYYDQNGNDTLIKSYTKRNDIWHPIQILFKEFNEHNKLIYSKHENINNYFIRKLFYTYDNNRNLTSKTELVCRIKDVCDSTFKEKSIYTTSGKLKVTYNYYWIDGKWVLKEKEKGK